MIAVPAVLKPSTSPSPANLPVVIDTVAPTRSRLSGSVTVARLDSTTGVGPSVNCAPGAALNVGASLTAVTLIVEVAVETLLLLAVPSSTVHVTVRVGEDPKSVGLSLVELNATVSSTAW